MIDAEAPIEVFDEIDSTLLEARRRAARGAFQPVWLVARRQSAGYGRRGRAWVSLEGNLLATHLFSTSLPASTLALLGFGCGLALAETMEAHVGAGRVRLKWPNDVMIDRAKAAGILIESGAHAGGKLWAALAFGVNIAVAPAALDQPTICLRQALPPDAVTPSAMEFLAGAKPRLEQWAARIAAGDFAPVRGAWLARAYGLGELARVAQGETLLGGRFRDISPTGELVLETAIGLRTISAGDVFFPEMT